MMKTKTGTLDNLKKKQAQLAARIQALEATEKSRERKRETRRKILVGAYYLDKANEEKKLASLIQMMDGYLKRDSDRVLFGLALKENRDNLSKKEKEKKHTSTT
jgi:large subunit ribosomal protein L7/L12